MHRTVVVSFLAFMLLAPSHGSAQALHSFEDLALRVNLDDQVQVEDQSGVKAKGRLTDLTRDEIAIRTEAGEKRFTGDTVREVAARGHALGKGALIGAGVGAALGALAECRGGAHAECPDGLILLGGLGAGAGLGVGALIHRTTIVYSEPEKRTFVSPAVSRHAVGVHVSRNW